MFWLVCYMENQTVETYTCSVQKLPSLSLSLWEFIWGIYY